MIYLISGSPRSGKSILSRRLARKKNIGYISTDNLRPIIISYYSKKEQPIKFPFMKMFNSTDVEGFFRKYNGQAQLKADIVESKSIWPGVKSLIEHLIECRMDYIIEGVHLVPTYVNKLKKYKKELRIVYLVKEDPLLLLKGLEKSKENNDWIACHIKNKEVLKIAAESMAIYGKYFRKEARKYKYDMINTEKDFNKKLNKAMKKLLNT